MWQLDQEFASEVLNRTELASVLSWDPRWISNKDSWRGGASSQQHFIEALFWWQVLLIPPSVSAWTRCLDKPVVRTHMVVPPPACLWWAESRKFSSERLQIDSVEIKTETPGLLLVSLGVLEWNRSFLWDLWGLPSFRTFLQAGSV